MVSTMGGMLAGIKDQPESELCAADSRSEPIPGTLPKSWRSSARSRTSGNRPTTSPRRKTSCAFATATQREFFKAKWGLIPSWAKDAKIGASCINARVETVDTKPAFRSAFKKRRCLVMADGFYEWRQDGQAAAFHQPEVWRANGVRRPVGILEVPGRPSRELHDLHDGRPRHDGPAP